MTFYTFMMRYRRGEGAKRDLACDMQDDKEYSTSRVTARVNLTAGTGSCGGIWKISRPVTDALRFSRNVGRST